MSGGVAAAVSASIAVCLALAVLHFGLCDALASLWGTRAGAFAPVEAAAAIGHGGLLTGQSAAVLGATSRCFREITRWVSGFFNQPFSLTSLLLLVGGRHRPHNRLTSAVNMNMLHHNLLLTRFALQLRHR